MTDQERVQKGIEYQRVFDDYIKPFIEEKSKVLFDAFSNVPASNVDALKDIRMQLTAIHALESDFMHYINDGNIAKYEMENENEQR